MGFFGVDTHETAQSITDLKNPFSTDKMVQFSTYCRRGYNGVWKYTGTIEFENDKTEGSQRFEADDFSALLKKMEAFINEMAGK